MTDRIEKSDQTTRLLSCAASWSASNPEQKEEPAKPVVPPAERTLTTDERSMALRSARFASHAYPGPVGDLISSKIKDYVLGGKLLEAFSLPRRLVRSMQSMEIRSPLPPRVGYDHLPAIYMPGSGQRWRYRTATDED
jgi:hypothetical protein